MSGHEILPPEGMEEIWAINEDRQRRINESDDRMVVDRIGRFRCKHPLELVFEKPLKEIKTNCIGQHCTYYRVGVCQITLAPGIHVRVMYENNKMESIRLMEDELRALWLKKVIRQTEDSPMRSALLDCLEWSA